MDQKVTAIIVNYFSGHLLKDIVSNLKKFLPRLGEIIIVNNSGEDISGHGDAITTVLCPEENLGYGRAINFGVRNSKYPNIVALNPDISIEKWDFDFENPPAKKFIVSGVKDGGLEYPKFPHPLYDAYRFMLFNLSKLFSPIDKLFGTLRLDPSIDFQPVDWVPGALIVTTKETFDAIGGFGEEYFLFYEEVDLCMRARLQNIEVLFSPKISYRTFEAKSSSCDVSEVKTVSEAESLRTYHHKYSNRMMTFLSVSLIKSWSICMVVFFGFLSKLFSSKKIKSKVKQYRIYNNRLKFSQSLGPLP
ncbi:MAG: hypothetical protein C0617_15790 [Desulfuromonas sp.]|uniref:hypothetical protein n=1 Tax=Desulfuromonas sp. TaxID=892 RepID=UPI000CC128FB|nr:hypothetical protein [Desulfuromonas sp.]PLX81798.1 MAG: hypothetical protein C0617_15790 [Desulfuromonas sp.]